MYMYLIVVSICFFLRRIHIFGLYNISWFCIILIFFCFCIIMGEFDGFIRFLPIFNITNWYTIMTPKYTLKLPYKKGDHTCLSRVYKVDFILENSSHIVSIEIRLNKAWKSNHLALRVSNKILICFLSL